MNNLDKQSAEAVVMVLEALRLALDTSYSEANSAKFEAAIAALSSIKDQQAQPVELWTTTRDQDLHDLIYAYESTLKEMRTHSVASKLILDWVKRLDFARDEYASTLRKQLKAPVEQAHGVMPVAWMWIDGGERMSGSELEQWETTEFSLTKPEHDAYCLTPLYAALQAPASLPEVKPLQAEDAKLFKHACWLNMQHAIHRYLMSNAEGRWDGSEKATRHIELCKFMVAVLSNGDPETIRHEFENEYQAVHEKTQELTSYLDEQIGFPITGRPDYEKLAPLFFEKFFYLAIAAIQAQGAKQI